MMGFQLRSVQCVVAVLLGIVVSFGAVAGQPVPDLPTPKVDPRPAEEKETKASKDTQASYAPDTGILLELNDCIEYAIANNLGLQLSRLSDRRSDYNIRIAWSQYFPTFTESILHSNSQGIGRNPPQGHGTTTLSSGVTQSSPWGTTLDFKFDESRRDWDQASRNVGVAMSQKLWKGAGTDAGLAEIRTARINRQITRSNMDLDTQKLIFQVRTDYTDIIRLLQEREVDRQGVRSAKTFLDLTQARERAGQTTKLDVYQAELQLKTREQTLVTNERQLGTAYDKLKRDMDVDLEENVRVVAEDINFGDKPEKGTVEVLEADEEKGIVTLTKRHVEDSKPIGEPKILFQAQHFNDRQMLEEALSNRIDLLNARRILAVQHIQTMLAKNGLGYQVDLVGSFDHGTTLTPLRGAGNNSDTNNWTVGINAKIPWGKIADKASYELALLDVQKVEIELKQVRTNVHADVRNIVRTLKEAEKSLMIQALAVEQAKRTVEATRISFERGLKSSFEVVRVEDDLLASKNAFIDLRLQYVVDLAQVELVVGKPTGRVDLEGQTLGGLIQSHVPTVMDGKVGPRPAPEADPSCEDWPLNRSRAYRCDPKPEPDIRLQLTPERKPPCNCELLNDKPWPLGNR